MNGLHQYSACLFELGKLEEAGQAVDKGLILASANSDHQLERSYFFKQKGILQYSKGNFKDALESFGNALPVIERSGDFAQLALIYFYTGKTHWNLGRQKEAVHSFFKVDSIFRGSQFILPQVRNSYELLIDFYRKRDQPQMQLYFTTQLLKADRVIAEDFTYLSKKIHKEYDTRQLLISKTKLERAGSRSKLLVAVLSAALIGMITVVVQRKNWIFAQGREVKSAPPAIEKEIRSHTTIKMKTTKPSEEMVVEILTKLSQLEKELFFLKKGITQNQIAAKLKTNTTYLSSIINEHKGSNFSGYVNMLRISYTGKMLRENSMWRKFNVENLALQSGFNNRVIFSRLFFDYYGMSSTEFIKHYPLESPQNT